MEKYLRKSNADVSAKIRELRKDMERELGGVTRWVDRARGPGAAVGRAARRPQVPARAQIEPMTFIERRNWPEPA